MKIGWILGIIVIVAVVVVILRRRSGQSGTISIIPSAAIPFEGDMAVNQLVQDLWHLDQPAREKAAQALRDNAGSKEAVLQYLCNIVMVGEDASVSTDWLRNSGKTHRDPNTKHAAEALGIIGDPRTVECLIKLLGRPQRQLPEGFWFDEDSRAAAVDALAKIGTSEAREALIHTLDARVNDNTRLSALWALCESGDQRAVSPILGARRRICAGKFTSMHQPHGTNWARDIDNYLKSNFGVSEKRILAEGFPQDS